MKHYERIFPTKSTYTATELLLIEDIHQSFNNLAKSMGYYPLISAYNTPLFRYMRGALIEVLQHFIPRMTDRQVARIVNLPKLNYVKDHLEFYQTYDKTTVAKSNKITPEQFQDHVDNFIKKLYAHMNEVCARRYKELVVDISSLTQVGMLLNELSTPSLLILRDLVWHDIIARNGEDKYYKGKGKDPISATDMWGNHKLFFYNVEHAADFFNLHPLDVAYSVNNASRVEGMLLKRIDDSEIPEPYTGVSLDTKEEYPDDDKVHLAKNPHLGE